MSELINATAFLQKRSSNTGFNVYDHLTALVRKIIVEQPENAVDYIEEYSRQLKQEYNKLETFFRDAYQPPLGIELALKWSKIMQTTPLHVKKNRDEDESIVMPIHTNVMELSYYLEQAGVFIPPHEMFCVGMCINQLKENVSAEKIRYWGKIFGIKKDYYVLEVTISDDNNEELNTAELIENDKVVETEDKSLDGPEDTENPEKIPSVSPEGIFSKLKIPPIPTVYDVKTVIAPPEKQGYGINSKVYYVCNELGDEWIRLPNVTPAEIVAARKIKRFFTGDLDFKVITYPPFPGDERNLLRAQIARISGSTQISPLGFFAMDDDEDGTAQKQLLENEEYEPISSDDLIDPSMAFWVHHHPYILTQGRTTWWSPKGNIEDGEESEEESLDEADEKQPEVGLPLLTPLSEDAMIGEIPPWTANLSTKMMPEWAIAIVRSNLWPGALAYCTTTSPQKFENFYMGWAQKYSMNCYSPPPLPKIQFEYQSGPEIKEMLDPTFAEEEADRIAKEKGKKEKEEENEEEENEDEGKEDEDELDDEEEDDNDEKQISSS